MVWLCQPCYRDVLNRQLLASDEIINWIESANSTVGKAAKTNVWLRTGYLIATLAALVSILLPLSWVLWPHCPCGGPVGPYIPENP